MCSGFLGGGIGPTRFKRAAVASADWWAVAGQTCIAAYKAVGAADLDTSYINLANPGVFNAAPGVAPTLGAEGWGFNGTQYLTTGVVPVNNQQWSAFVRYASFTPTLDHAPFFARDGLRFFGIELAASESIYYCSGGYTDKGPRLSAAVLGFAGTKAYRDGADESISIPSAIGSLASAIVIGAYNNGGSIIEFFPGTIAALAIYSSTLSAADVAALTPRMAALT